MRKLVVLLVVIAALGAGYYVYWHKKADDFRNMFAQSVESLNQGAKPFTKDLTLVRYDSVAVTGFPFAMVLEVGKPVFDIPLSAIVGQMPQEHATAPNPPPYEWVEEVSYGDKLTLTGNMMGDHFTFTADGDRLEKSLVNRTARHTLVTSTSAPYVCHLGVERPAGGTPWTMQPIFTDLKTFLTIFRSFDCGTKNIAVKDASSGAVMLTSDAISVSASNEPSDGANHKIIFSFDSDKTKALPAFDATVKDYMLMFYTLAGKADQAGSPIPASEAGEQNMKVDIRYDGPISAEAFADPGAHFHFDINHLDMESALANLTLEMHVADVPQGTSRALSFNMHEKMNVTERDDQLLEAHFTSMLQEMAKHPNPNATDPVQGMLQKLATLGAPDQIVAKLYPQFHTLGKTMLDIDFNVKGPNEDAKFLRRGVFTLDDFSLVTDPYGIKIKGKSDATVAGKMPSADFSLTCLSCDTLVSDLGNYLMRVEWAVNQATNPGKPQQITAGLITGFTQFLHGISENASAKDLVIHLVSNEKGFAISGKQIPEVVGLYMSAVAPYLPKPSAPPAAPAR